MGGRWQLVLGSVMLLCVGRANADDWPQWLGPQRDGVWREQGILDKFPRGGPRVLWRTPIGGGYAGPAVSGGKVYVTDRQLDAGESDPPNPFARSRAKGKERVLCLDEKTGKVIWKHAYPCKYDVSYPAGPRTTPSVADGKVYALGAMGNLVCLDAATGELIWEKDFVKDYEAQVPLWGFASHPLVDGDKVICLVGGEGSVAVAFDKDTGKEKWRSLKLEASELGYAPPMIFEAGGVRQLVIWHPEAVNSLDPETGKVYWSVPFRLKANLSVPTPTRDGDLLLLTSFYNGSMVLQLDREKPAAEVVWKSEARGENPGQTKDLSAIMATPYIRDGIIYGVCSYGELRGLEAKTGKRLWQDLRATGSENTPTERWANAFLTPNGDRWFLFNEKGDLIIAKLTAKGYEEIDRAHIIEPTNRAQRRSVVWTHPAYANKCIYVRNDKEIICVSLAAE